ncbi:hypothetical protein [Pseudomonas sp. Gutcm_11s]|uniref:hypothetical protein n=1 Tax=Pseudomonas sp. Gutcm_11s TaxID=3026088 RepID=UPI00235EA1DB|nr:hypothetical protein [Pseudomonas sp. Gutcm_11s]MDD0841763.1 hypothetical protein [Pseudomonas sp. Gutcm_11s]
MNISIQQVKSATGGALWQVCLDQHGVSFRSEAEARSFVNVLRARLQAPHPLPWRGASPVRSAS